MRELGLEGAELVGKGFFSNVYRLNDEQIVKVFIRDPAPEVVNAEWRKARYASLMGAPAAVTYDVVRVEGKYGLVLENFPGGTLGSYVRKDPTNRDAYIREFIRTLRAFNNTEVPANYCAQLPDARALSLRLAEKLRSRLTPEEYAELSALLKALPEEKHLIHGDIHLDNMLYDGRQAIVIDMDTLAVGPVILELAGLYSAYVGFNEYEPGDSLRFHHLSTPTAAAIFYSTYKEYYGNLAEEEQEKTWAELRKLAYFHMMVWAGENAPEDEGMFEFFRGRFDGVNRPML